MAKACRFCNHKDRAGLEAALLNGSKTQQQVADVLGINRSGVSRHMRQHINAVGTETADAKRLDDIEKRLTELEQQLKQHRISGGHRLH